MPSNRIDGGRSCHWLIRAVGLNCPSPSLRPFAGGDAVRWAKSRGLRTLHRGGLDHNATVTTSGSGGRRHVRVIGLLLALSLLAGCSAFALNDSSAPSKSSTTSSASSRALSGNGYATQRFRAVQVIGSTSMVHLTAAELSADADAGLRQWLAMGVLVSVPVQIGVVGGLPVKGVRLTRTYAAPLPPGAAASFVYFDPTLNTWRQAPSRLSKDRRNLSAQIHHLSLWSDIITGSPTVVTSARESIATAGAVLVDASQAAVSTAKQLSQSFQAQFVMGAEAFYYGVGKLFDVRVDAPLCEGKTPEWLDKAIFMADDSNNPIRWCAGHDPKHPDVLVIKARVNRGFGYFASTAVDPEWVWNSTYDQGTVNQIWKAVSNFDQTVASNIADVTGGGVMVGPGEEIDFGFTRDQVDEANDQPLIKLDLPGPAAFVSTVIAKQLVASGLDYSTSVVAATLAAARCADKIKDMSNPLSGGTAAIECFQASSEAVAKILATGLLKKGMDPLAAGKLAGTAAARASIYLALVGPVFNILNWAVESGVSESAREATAFLRITPTTLVTNINPLTSSGALRKGWTIAEVANGDAVNCAYDQGSPSAVSPGTHRCGSTADSTDACWTSPRYAGMILCLFDPFTNVLHERWAVDVPKSTPAAARPEPVGLELYDGTRWRLRVGGAWGGRKDGLVGAYSCYPDAFCDYAKTGKDIVILTESGSTLDTSTQPWTVRVGELGSPQTDYPPPKTVKVRKALYISAR